MVGRADDGFFHRRRGHHKKPTSPVVYLLGGHGNHHMKVATQISVFVVFLKNVQAVKVYNPNKLF